MDTIAVYNSLFPLVEKCELAKAENELKLNGCLGLFLTLIIKWLNDRCVFSCLFNLAI
jgi:hypothetical protein